MQVQIGLRGVVAGSLALHRLTIIAIASLSIAVRSDSSTPLRTNSVPLSSKSARRRGPSFSVAGTTGGCGQSTASVGCLLAHPVNVIRQTLDISQSFVTLFPRLDKGLMLHSFFLTILLLKRLRAGCVILAKDAISSP